VNGETPKIAITDFDSTETVLSLEHDNQTNSDRYNSKIEKRMLRHKNRNKQSVYKRNEVSNETSVVNLLIKPMRPSVRKNICLIEESPFYIHKVV
jgi:hypothetical protein